MNTYIREIVDKTNLLQSYQSEEGTLINVENRDRVRTILCDIVNNIEKFLNCNMKLNSIQIYNFINFFKKDIQRGSII